MGQKSGPEQPEDGLDFNSFAKISTDDAGNVYWSGNYEATSLDFGNGFTVTRTCTNGCQEGFLVKADAGGTIAFAKALHASGGEDFTVAGVASSDAGVHVISGSFKGTELWLQGGANIGGLTEDGYFTALYNASGGAEWIAFLTPNSGIPNVTGIAMSNDGERLAVVGNYSDSLLNFGNSAVTASFSNNKRFAVWYNKVGQPLGAGSLSSTANVDILDIRLDSTYKLWTACDYTGNLTWNGTSLGTAGSGSGNNLIAILEPAAAFASPKIEYSGSSFPVNSIALGPDGAWYTGGYITNQVTIPGAGNFTSQGCSDVLVSSGVGLSIDWARTAGGSGCETLNNNYGGTFMDTDNNGNLYLCGKFSNNADFDDEAFTGNGLWVGKLATGTVAAHDMYSAENQLNVYPNPAGNSMVLDVPENSSANDIVRVYAATGSLVAETSTDANALTFDTEQWSPGTYFLVYTHTRTGKISTGKVVVQH